MIAPLTRSTLAGFTLTTGNAPSAPDPLAGPIQPPPPEPVFDAENLTMQRRMRFNPLRALDPQNLSMAHDQFDMGILRQAALLWDAMIRRDDTLSFVVPQLENAIAAKPWGVFKKKNADPATAAAHAAALEYFYGNVTAIDAFDRNVRGDRHLLLKQMGASYAMRYAAHHFVWQPQPGEFIEIDGVKDEDGREGAKIRVPKLTAQMEYVPLWFFENVSGTLRFLPFGGFGIEGQSLNWDGEWMVTTGQGMMFSAAGCYVFKRLTFQDWTIFNERYAQQKVIGQTSAQKDSAPGQAMASIVENFNSDMGIVLYESQAGDKPPISLLGPEGTVSVDLFERFLDRQDRKMTVMFRGSDLRNMSREKEVTGVSAQRDETESMELAHCAAIASACRTFIDRAVIKYCFGAGVEPAAFFGLPEMDNEDAQELRESAGFLADRGAQVELDTVAERLGITLTDNAEDALQPLRKAPAPEVQTEEITDAEKTANAADLRRLQQLVEEAVRTVNSPFDPDKHPRNPKGSVGGGRFMSEAEIAANIQRGRAALYRVIEEKADVLSAMEHTDVGPIDFLWDHKDHGVKHLIERREYQDKVRPDLNKLSVDELIAKIPEVIARGVASPRGDKIEIDHEGIRVILARRDGKSAAPWMMSGFEFNPQNQREGGRR